MCLHIGVTEKLLEAAMTTHTVFYRKLEDGSFIVASIDSPRFCVGASNKEEAIAKAKRALEYYDSVAASLKPPERKPQRVINPSFERAEIYA
jgi:hypothetical protein